MLPSPHDRALTHMKTSTIATKQKNKHDQNDDHDPAALFGNLPEGRRRKFILVEDAQRGSRVRVKVMLDQVDVNEIPDSYRKSNSVYPRTYVPVHGPFGRKRGPGDRDSDDDDDGGGESEEAATVGRTIVPVPMLEGEGTLGVPRISKRKRGREGVLNDLGYRMSWGQSRVFAGRSVFLQRSCKFCYYFPRSRASCGRLTLYQWTRTGTKCAARCSPRARRSSPFRRTLKHASASAGGRNATRDPDPPVLPAAVVLVLVLLLLLLLLLRAEQVQKQLRQRHATRRKSSRDVCGGDAIDTPVVY